MESKNEKHRHQHHTGWIKDSINKNNKLGSARRKGMKNG